MLAPERRNQILNLVIQKKSVLVKDLSMMFDVTGETIRKDLAVLEKEGKILKTYGGAYVCDGVQNEIPITLRESLYTDEKKGDRCCLCLSGSEWRYSQSGWKHNMPSYC